ncbi:MAG: beta strand repeat-containing protein, partial [Bacteroidia bacterium]
TRNFTITQPTAISTATAAQTNVSCNGGSNGSASVTPSGGAGGYTYSWSPSGGAAATATGLSAGTYTVTVTDANGCTATRNFTIIVLDTIKPIVVTQNRTVYLNAAGTASVSALQVNNGSSDACGVASLSLSKTSFNCNDTGANLVTLTVTDVNNNSQTANATITVLDTIKPVVNVQNGIVLYLNQTGSINITPNQFNNGSTDNCGIKTVSISPNTISCADIGIKTITLTVTDNSGNVQIGTTTAVVLDPIAPIARPKQSVSVYLSANGQAVINPSLMDSASIDNCSITARLLSQSVFNCSNIGANNVLFTVQDQSGNANSANIIVTVFDTVRPIATISNQNIYLNSTGTASITAAQVNNNSTDNCGVASVAINKNTFSCADLGSNNILFTATDINGNIRTANVNVNVFDSIRPIVRPRTNVLVYLNSTGTGSITLSNVDSASSDNCSIASRTLSQTNFTCANLGNNIVTLTALDVTGNEGSRNFNVTVIDTIKPLITAQAANIYLNSNGVASLSTSQVVTSSSDNCSSASISLSQTNFTCANLGSNTVNITATDASGNFRIIPTTVTVIDSIKPILNVQNRTIYLNASGTASLTATQVNNGSTDNCGIQTTTISKTNFLATDLGLNTISFTATDASGNSQTSNVVITVIDTVRPIAITQNRTIYLNTTGNATVTANQVNNGSTDNSVSTTLQLSKTAFTCSDLGTNQVLLTVSDGSNNSTSASATITVLDTIKPNVVAQNLNVYLNGLGLATITPQQVNNGSTDNCAISNLSLSKTNFGCSDRGANNITFTATDASGNFTTANVIVTIIDTIKPNIVVNNNLNLYLNASGTVSLTTAQVNNGSTDNCGITNLSLSKTSFNGTNLGLNTITFTATDASTNSQSVTLNVIVIDTVKPIVNANGKTIYLNNSGSATLTASELNNGSTDNVAIGSISINKTTFNCNDVGDNSVQFTATDLSGNSSSTLVNI